jgi:two-component system invasion response regulator UvrY
MSAGLLYTPPGYRYAHTDNCPRESAHGDYGKGSMLILVIDDHPLLRHAVRQLIEQHYPSSIVREAANADEAMRIVRAQLVELMILDIALPDQSGLTLLKQIKQIRPKTKCLILSIHEDPHYVGLALKHGASGYLTKESAPEELQEAVRVVLAGGRYITEALNGVIDENGRPITEMLPHLHLSSRELEVLSFLAKGRTVSQAATRLKLSVKTVSTYRTRLLEKLRLGTTADLIRYAIDHSLVQ